MIDMIVWLIFLLLCENHRNCCVVLGLNYGQICLTPAHKPTASTDFIDMMVTYLKMYCTTIISNCNKSGVVNPLNNGPYERITPIL